MTGRSFAAVPAVTIAAGAVAVASLAASGFGAGAAIVGAAGAVLVLITGSPWRGAAVATAAIAVACTAVATPSVGSDIGRGLMIAAPPIGICAAVLSVGPRSRRAAGTVVIGALLAGPIRALFDDPFLDAGCAGCRHSAFAVLADRSVAQGLGTVGAVLLTAGAAAMIRRSPAPVLAAAGTAGALALLPVLGLDPVLVGPAALAFALLAGASRAVALATARRRLAELERGLAGTAGATELLRHTAHDPALTVVFPPLPDSTDGMRTVVVDGDVVAAVRSSSAALPDLLDPPAPALVVALANERLDRQLEERVEELRVSRARVVRRADEERRRLERDLHDGAQQHVLALGFDLRAAIVREADSDRRAVLESCLAETSLALDDLRDISHGVYPPLLAIAGLGPALRALASRTPHPIEVGALPGRLPQSVERVAYLLVSELAHISSAPVEVAGTIERGALRLDVGCADAGPGSLLRERIAAQDGTIEEEDGRWRLTVPCG